MATWAVVTGAIRLSPAESRIDDLKRDYQAMAEMFFGEPPLFDDVLQVIGELEERINSA